MARDLSLASKKFAVLSDFGEVDAMMSMKKHQEPLWNSTERGTINSFWNRWVEIMGVHRARRRENGTVGSASLDGAYSKLHMLPCLLILVSKGRMGVCACVCVCVRSCVCVCAPARL